MPHPFRRACFLVLIIAALTSCAAPASSPQTTARPAAPLPTPILGAREVSAIPAVAARLAAWQRVVRADPPVLTRVDLDAPAQAAQDLALRDARVRATLYISGSVPLRSEVFGVVPARASDLSARSAACAKACYKVVIYNYAYNRTVTALVAPAAQQVHDVQVIDGAQPDVPPDLAQLAVEIARAAPEVQAALQMVPPAEMATMQATKTALNGSACERSRHLCVAPTFVWGDRALWAIVDLTELAIVGVQWTDVGASARRKVTEASLQNEVVAALCDQPAALTRGAWSLSYGLSSSDGLVLSDLRYAGKPVVRQAKIVDWHVSYSAKQGFGYSDGIGCPTFSSAVVVPFNPPAVEPIRSGTQEVGFALVQDFRTELWPAACNYRYQNRYEFYADGRFRVVGVNIGRGCGVSGTYRPVMRVVPADERPALTAHTGAASVAITHEQWLAYDTAAPTATLALDLALSDGRGYRVATGAGATQPDPAAFIYVTRYRPEEGDADLPSVGGCCSSDERQGPELFIDAPPEELAGGPVVIWYVPRLVNAARERCWADARIQDGVFVADTWPCSAGPTFLPVS
jgi:hypothetical protein